MYISNRLKKLREARDMDRHEMAKGIVSYSHLCNIEAGRFEPSEEILIAMARKLKVKEEYLLKFREQDTRLGDLLQQLKEYIDLIQLDEAKQAINDINQEYPVIFSIYQEIFYLILKTYYLYKKNKHEIAFTLFEKEVVVLLENHKVEKLPSEFREVYYYIRAIKSFFSDDYISSYQYFLLQLPLVKSKMLKGLANYNLALVLFKLNNIMTAIDYGEEALDLFLHERKWPLAAEADNLLGILYWENNDLVNSEKHLQNALDISNQYNLICLKARVLHNLGLVYKKQNTSKSLEYFYMSINIKKENNIKKGLVKTYDSILIIYIEQELLDEANKLLVEAKQYCEKDIDLFMLKANEARINLKSNNNSQYELIMGEVESFFSRNNMWKHLKDIAEELGDYYAENKKYKLAAQLFKKALEANKNICQGGQYEKN